MCFFNSMSAKAVTIASRYGRKMDIVDAWKEIMAEKVSDGDITNLNDLYRYRLAEGMYNVPAYSEPHCVIVSGSDELQVMQWGLLPRSIKTTDADRYNKKNWFKNARAEELFTKWPWRNLIYRNRCIIPSTGYFEYHYNNEGKTQPYFIYLTDREIFSMAGLWDRWENKETGEIVDSFVQITTAANSFTEKIHNGGQNPFRMPLILKEEDESRWLDPGMIEQAEIEKLLRPYPAQGMTAHPVRKDFNRTNPFSSQVNEDIQKEDELPF